MAFEQTLLDEDFSIIGQQLHAFAELMYPVCRSITGQGVRDTLEMVREKIPLTMHQVTTGTQVFDWEVHREWNIKDAPKVAFFIYVFCFFDQGLPTSTACKPLSLSATSKITVYPSPNERWPLP